MDNKEINNQSLNQQGESKVEVASPSTSNKDPNSVETHIVPVSEEDGHVIEIKQAAQQQASPYDEDNDSYIEPPQLPTQPKKTAAVDANYDQPTVDVEEKPLPNLVPNQPGLTKTITPEKTPVVEQPKVEPQKVKQPQPQPEPKPEPVAETPKEEIKQTAPATPIKTNKVFTNIDVKQENVHNEFNIKVIGIGGAGCNVINHIAANHKNIVEYATLYAFNTDLCSLRLMKNVDNLFLLNKEELKGYGSGCDPEVGKRAVQKDAEVIKKELEGTDILFIIAGMGKGAGSGGAPELAQIAKNLGILTVSIVNMPSVACEGNIIYNNAFNSLQSLIVYSDSVSTISNEKIISNNKNISFYNAYELANKEIADIIDDIITIIFKPSVMNVDFADLKTFFKENKFFMANRFSVDSNGLNQLKIREALANRIKKSFSDVNINNCPHVIANISMAKDIPTTILADINKSFAEITKNDKLTLVSGINYQDEKKIDISFLVSGKNYSANFNNAFEADSATENKWVEPTIKVEAVNDSEANEYDNLMKDVDLAAKPTEDVAPKDKPDIDDIG